MVKNVKKEHICPNCPRGNCGTNENKHVLCCFKLFSSCSLVPTPPLNPSLCVDWFSSGLRLLSAHTMMIAAKVFDLSLTFCFNGVCRDLTLKAAGCLITGNRWTQVQTQTHTHRIHIVLSDLWGTITVKVSGPYSCGRLLRCSWCWSSCSERCSTTECSCLHVRSNSENTWQTETGRTDIF